MTRSLLICSEAVNDYVDAVRHLACHVLDLLGEGLGLSDPTSFSRLISAVDNDSLIRINHYPPPSTLDGAKSGNGSSGTKGSTAIGFGEHTDPQILSVLRANDVDGLQVLLPSGRGDEDWFQVPADPSAFFINVGDLLQVSGSGSTLSSFDKLTEFFSFVTEHICCRRGIFLCRL